MTLYTHKVTHERAARKSHMLWGPRKTRNGRKGTGNGEWGMGIGSLFASLVLTVFMKKLTVKNVA